MGSNPFALLFPSLEVAVSYQKSVAREEVMEVEEVCLEKPSGMSDELAKDIQELNGVIEEIFLVTLNKFSVVGGPQKQLVYLSSLAEVVGPHHQSWLDLPTLEQVYAHFGSKSDYP